MAATKDPLDEIPNMDPTELIIRAEKMLSAIVDAGTVELSDPITFLALQLIGPVMAVAVGDDPERSSKNLCDIAKLLDVTQLRTYLKRYIPA